MSAHDPVNILLVDDNPAKLLTYEAILGELGENLIKARSAGEAFQELLKREYAVLLVDVSMPEVDGFELAAMIRQHPRFEKTAIIFISAMHLADSDRLRGFKLGAADYITVPVAPELLRAKVRVATDLYRRTLELEQLNAQLEQRVAEQTAALREALRRSSAASVAGRMGAWHFDAENNRVTYSDELLALIGIDKSEFAGTIEAVETFTHPDDIERRRNDRAKSLAEGDWHEHDFRIIRPDGEVLWMYSRGNVVRRPDGTAVNAYGVMMDITERKREEERQRLRLAELDHRVKNTLTSVGLILERSIAEHARATAASVDALTAALTGRLDAIARTHTRLSRSNSTELRSLVEEELAPYRSETNARVEGPDLAISPEAARALGMVMHELATNAVKYGAFSNCEGQVAVGWQLTGEHDSVQVKLVWEEAGGPTVVAPKRQGLGTRLIRDLLRHELGGQVELSLPPAGMRCEIEIPLARMSGAGASSAAREQQCTGLQPR